MKKIKLTRVETIKDGSLCYAFNTHIIKVYRSEHDFLVYVFDREGLPKFDYEGGDTGVNPEFRKTGVLVDMMKSLPFTVVYNTRPEDRNYSDLLIRKYFNMMLNMEPAYTPKQASLYQIDNFEIED